MIIYAFVHKKKFADVMNPFRNQNIKCNAISGTAQQFQCYDKKSFYNMPNQLRQTFEVKTYFLRLPDDMIIRIMKYLNNESLIQCMFTCKQLFQLGSLFCHPNIASKRDVTLHPSKGICLKYKFAFDLDRKKRELTICNYLKEKLTYPVDPDLCVCPLCHETCSCDFSKHQHAGSLKKLLFTRCKLGTVIIQSSADFHYMIQNLYYVPRNLKIDIPISKCALDSIFNKFRFYDCLDYILDVRMFTHIEIYWPFIAPVVNRLHIRFLPINFAYTNDLPVVKTILRSHLKAVKYKTPKMTKLTVTNCLFLEEIFFFHSFDPRVVWLKTIKEIHITNSRIKCSLFKRLTEMTSLNLLNIKGSDIQDKCKAEHFNHYFRTDFLNFENVPNTNHILFKRNSFLRIFCDTNNSHCQCQDVLKKPSSIDLLHGRFTFEKCQKCMKAPEKCYAT